MAETVPSAETTDRAETIVPAAVDSPPSGQAAGLTRSRPRAVKRQERLDARRREREAAAAAGVELPRRQIVVADSDGDATRKRARSAANVPNAASSTDVSVKGKGRSDIVGAPRRPQIRRDRALGLPFEADYNDHFETSAEAIADVFPAVNMIRLLTFPADPSRFTVYDPYFCAGAVVKIWHDLGIEHVIHEKRDFYKDIEAGEVPRHDHMLVTNPPFSGDHLSRLFTFLVQRRKPFAVLCPDYIAKKAWYVKLVRQHFAAAKWRPKHAPLTTVEDATHQTKAKRRKGSKNNAASSSGPAAAAMQTSSVSAQSGWAAAFASHPAFQQQPASLPPTAGSGDAATPLCHAASMTGGLEEADDLDADDTSRSSTWVTPAGALGPEPFYIIPRQRRYEYHHPLGAGHGLSHFASMWYVWAGPARIHEEVLRELRFGRTEGTGGGGTDTESSAGRDLGSASTSRDGKRVVCVEGLQALAQREALQSIKVRAAAITRDGHQ